MTMQEAQDGHTGLAARLIEAGIALLLEGSPLTLRGAAARAGVSHGAPAHHFDGLAGLETAVVARGFRLFAARMAQAAPTGGDPMDWLLARAQVYCDFARDHGPLFQCMFASDRVNHRDPELVDARMSAYAALREVCAPFATEEYPPLLLETVVWSTTHGFAMLQLLKPGRHGAGPETPIMLEPVLRHIVRRDR